MRPALIVYFEGGYRRGLNGYIWDDVAFKYSFQFNTWIKIQKEFNNEKSLILYTTFNYQRSIYSIVQGTDSMFSRMNRFNLIAET